MSKGQDTVRAGLDAAALVNVLRIDVEAMRAGVEALASRPETAAMDKGNWRRSRGLQMLRARLWRRLPLLWLAGTTP